MHIRDMAPEDRPQEKLLYGGAEELSNAELIALVLRTGGRGKSAVELALELIDRSGPERGGIAGLDVREMMEIDGIGRSKACSIAACVELSRRLSSSKKRRLRAAGTPDKAAELVMERLRHEKQEHLIALLLNTRCEVESEETIAIGGLSAAPVHPRDVFRPAVRRSAAAIILIHNHPSGDPEPSVDDIEVTRRLCSAARIVGISIADHIIIGDGTFVSLRSRGVFDEFSDDDDSVMERRDVY
jgi:DNA repair protein RadC